MQRIFQPMTAFFHKVLKRRRLTPTPASTEGRLAARPMESSWLANLAIFSPALADSQMVVDTPMMMIFAGLAIAAGISFGMLYRHMQNKEEGLAARAQNAEEELRAMLTMTDDAVLVLDSIGLVRAVNPAAEELFCKSEDDFAGEEISRLIEHPLQLTELTKNGPANFDATALRLGGETIKVEILLSQVQHAHGTSFLAMMREKHAAAAPTVATPDVGAQIAKHTHDLNNQLTGIVGHLSLILMSAQTDPAVHERIVSAKRNTLRAQETNRRLQSIARGDLIDPAQPNSPAPGTIVPMPFSNGSNGNGTITHPARVLVLDDEEAICALVATALGAQGVEVTEATNSTAAIRACEEAVKNGKPFNLVIADLSLPNDIPGTEAVLRLREIDPQIKAIVSSGYDQDPIMSDFRHHGFDGALAKPYELHKLGRVVREILEGARSASRKSA